VSSQLRTQQLSSEGKEVTDGLPLHQEMDVYFMTLDPVLYCHKLWEGNRGITDICFWLEITENCIKLDVWSVYVTLVSLSLVCHYKLTLE
jgi:hypothetical protein